MLPYFCILLARLEKCVYYNKARLYFYDDFVSLLCDEFDVNNVVGRCALSLSPSCAAQLHALFLSFLSQSLPSCFLFPRKGGAMHVCNERRAYSE